MAILSEQKIHGRMSTLTRAEARREAATARLAGILRAGGSRMLTDRVWNNVARRLELKPVELRIVQGIFDEWPEERIAEEAGVSPNTIHSHIKRLYLKLGAVSRVGLVLRVVSQALELQSLGEPCPDAVIRPCEATYCT